MKNKKVLITGAASGIGLCLAERFLDAGAYVIMTDVDYEKLKEVGEEFMKVHYKKVNYYPCDVGSRYDVRNLKDWAGEVDILVNNAGIGCNKELANMNDSEWERLIDVNLLGPIYHINAFLPSMIARGSGHIVNVSSGQAFFRLPTWGAYAATKVALGAMSELMAYELAKYGIKVTTIYPFMVNTPFYKGVEGDTFVARMSMKLLPLYSDTPEKVAEKILNAVQKEKKVEMVNPINHVGFVMRSLPPVANSITWLVNKFLAK
jgi:NAD(P)-dependent dehydrogenase (short-subunit alcohol dehydrogenase family)